MLPLVAFFYFNPRSHERSDRHTGNRSKRCKNFNPRSHERSDGRIMSNYEYLGISIHAPTRGATLDRNCLTASARFQSTLPREERPRAFILCSLSSVISIHAPTRGATKLTSALVLSQSNFNPRSHERSDNFCRVISGLVRYFNPRSHERSDAPSKDSEDNDNISIHAPTRGATLIKFT